MQHKSIVTVLLLYVVAFRPVFPWYISRITDPSDMPYYLFPLLTVAMFIFFQKPVGIIETQSLGIAAGFIVAYAASYHFVPAMIKAAFAFVVFYLVVRACYSKESIKISMLFLLLLSLPLIPSLQFYCGYPMRLLVTHLAYPLVQLCGQNIVIEGTSYYYAGSLIEIDAPCSGINMLWVGFYLLFTLTMLYRIAFMRTMLLSFCVFLLLIFGNVIRIANLFYIHFAGFQEKDWLHYGIGVVLFLFISLVLIRIVNPDRRKSLCETSEST
ncbi:archaeosortase/exosortase family protein [bacterium]|nr:archaeosortase/exosortase family protein [bacterium]